METKVIHLHFKDDGTSIIHDWYFGSLKAIYDSRTVEVVICSELTTFAVESPT